MEKEIEFKNLLTKNEYESLVQKYTFSDFFSQINYYYDFTNQDLLNKQKMLRVRKKGNHFELTLKIPENNFVAEYNQNIDLQDFMHLNATGVLPSGIIYNLLAKEHNMNYFLKMFGLLKTDRQIYRDGDFLICLDQNDYLNHLDYELEIECLNYDDGLIYFENYLKKNQIVFKKTNSKVIRFMERLKEGHTCSTRRTHE